MTRVAITGIGLVTPLGVGRAATLAGLESGRRVDAAPPPSERAALPEPRVCRVPDDFDPRRFVTRRKDLKRMARANVLAVAAARLAIEDAGLTGADLHDAGLFLGVGREPGEMDTLLPAVAHSRGPDGHLSMARLAGEGMSWMNPLSSLKTLPNMSVAHASIACGTMGPGQALCAGPGAGVRAIREAAASVAEGRAPVALAGATDAPVAFIDRVSAARTGDRLPRGEAAVVLVLEPEAAAQARGATILGYVAPKPEIPAAPVALGDCGAATLAVAFAIEIARGTRRAAPAVHVKPTAEPIAITGVGLRTPLGRDFAPFTTALLGGVSGVAPVRAFDARAFPVTLACEVPDFEPSGLPDALAAAICGLDDRKGELALVTALEAVADRGGLDPDAGLVYGTGLSSVSLRELEQDCLPFLDAEGAFDFAAFGRTPAPADPQAPRRHAVDRPLVLLRDHLGLRGPTACHFSACASGAAAVGHAVDLIRRGEAPMVLAGAADSMIHPFGLLPFILLGATTPNPDAATAARPFDKDRDGFVMGEGGAFFVLEPLARARAEGRHVYGVLLGHGTSCDAWRVTAPHPEGAGAERALRAALADAGVAAGAVDYINAHGTSTPLNDVVESAAIARVFGAPGPAVSSSKGQLGHAIAAAGAVELAACLAAFAGGRLPPNPHTRHVDPAVSIDLVEANGRAGTPGIIVSNSFGFGGQNAVLVIQHPDAAGSRA